ncbi:MAG: hypothetical protein A2846_02740 [Candidatus Doudnabacteria bacterium RIFCSPHIGHO2_01_FULL_49_9]|uniref:Uncharacterized protein n=1 Tax=Candidatus Doudnabacteria bacterium RIFCSPHIGHO2_01_FULL_49_9 TaxID=1817827 RepID=A0A1F5P307_9BACT|nr:MAG: hypothetical protein A2846_02740 [Candidatus Doudnabacteria bacterium RIFCSPHIGHO2_01_FULL_49_9]
MKLLIQNLNPREFDALENERFASLASKLDKWASERYQPKFVIVTKDGENFLAIFSGFINHSNMVESLTDYELVGAGMWNALDKPGAFYKSMSCRETYGYEKPGDPNVADALLVEVEQLLKQVFEACQPQS